jgi:hypothetical protein
MRPLRSSRSFVLAALTLAAGCASSAPPVPAPLPAGGAPHGWKTDPRLTGTQADARCQTELMTCPHAFAIFSLPPSPCAHQGTRCMQTRSTLDGRWSCGCDLCASSAECQPGERCGTVAPPCSRERAPRRCLAGPAPEATPCLEIDPPRS